MPFIHCQNNGEYSCGSGNNIDNWNIYISIDLAIVQYAEICQSNTQLTIQMLYMFIPYLSQIINFNNEHRLIYPNT